MDFQLFWQHLRQIFRDETGAERSCAFSMQPDGGARDGQIAARALFKGGLYDRGEKAFVPIARLMETIGTSAESPKPSAEAEAFVKADRELEQGGRR